MCIFRLNFLYSCVRVRRAHTLCPWGVDLSLGSGWLWSEWRTLIFKHMLLGERDGKWFMIYTVVSQLKRSTLHKDSVIPPCLCALLSSCSYRVWLILHSVSKGSVFFLIILFLSYHLSTILFHCHLAEWRAVYRFRFLDYLLDLYWPVHTSTCTIHMHYIRKSYSYIL